LKKINIGVFILYITTRLFGQSFDSVTSFGFADTNGAIKRSEIYKGKIHLIGEVHHDAINPTIKLAYLYFLNNQNIYPKYFLFEDGAAACFNRNLYLESGNQFYLDAVAIINPYRAEEIELRNYYLSLPEQKRFKCVGVDVEYGYNNPHIVFKHVLVKYQKNLASTLKRLDKANYLQLLEDIEMKENPYNWDNKLVRSDVDSLISWLQSKDSIVLKNALTAEDFDLIARIAKGYLLGKGGKLFVRRQTADYNKKREFFIANNIYSLFLKDTSAHYFGKFGMSHVRLNITDTIKKALKNLSFAYTLNADKLYSKTNGKIYSNTIYYEKHKSIYVFLKNKKKELAAQYKQMSSKEFKLVPSNKSITNNLILFKK
jgi:signal recognition particle subunit SEC65